MSALLKVKSNSYFPSPFLNLPFCYAANCTDLLGLDTAYHSNFGYSYKPSLNTRYWKVNFWHCAFGKMWTSWKESGGKHRNEQRSRKHNPWEKMKVLILFSLEKSRLRGKKKNFLNIWKAAILIYFPSWWLIKQEGMDLNHGEEETDETPGNTLQWYSQKNTGRVLEISSGDFKGLVRKTNSQE